MSRRFTGELAARAGRLTTVDFMEHYVAENRRCHGHLAHVEFLCADVVDLELPQVCYRVSLSHFSCCGRHLRCVTSSQ